MKLVSPFAPTITGGVWRLFAVAASLLLIYLSLLYWNLQRVEEMSSAVQKTEQIERELLALSDDLLNAETGQRGYLLTQNKDYLQPYLNARSLAPIRIARLRGLIADPQARASLDRLEPVVAAKLEELAHTVDLVQQNQLATALAVVREGRGKRLMDEFRQLISDTVERELHLAAERRGKLISGLYYALLTVILGGALAIGLLFLSAARTAARLRDPIAALLDGIKAIAGGRLDYRVPVKSADEIGRITVAVNAMAEQALAAQRSRDAALAELKRSNAELDSFAYVASHDLKAPLRGIRNLAQWIGEDIETSASDETRDNLRLLNNRVDRLDNLLENLLAYSRIGRKTTVAETVDSGRLVADIGEYLAPAAGFVISCDSPMPTLFTPKAPLEQVLRNLISNAIKHHDGASGRVEVSARDIDADTVEFRVEDDGPGIATEFHERIFMMFQTLKPRDQVEGSGMGLAIVKKTVESFGGQVRVEASRLARGTAFVFSWPREVREQDSGE